jgi:hypothetical protein
MEVGMGSVTLNACQAKGIRQLKRFVRSVDCKFVGFWIAEDG